MGMKLGWFLLLALAAPALIAQDTARAEEELARGLSLPKLDQVELPGWRRFVRPTDKEIAYERIDWLEDFASGVRASEKQQKPLLFWAMNGHPLGCT